MQADKPVIEVENLVRSYGPVEAVRGLSFRVEPGRCYALFGRNGAGKTTTIKCLLNLLRPDSGRVRVFGLDPAEHEVEVKLRVGYVPDTIGVYPWMTLREWLDYQAAFRAQWNREKEKALLRGFQLDEHRRLGSLSRGEKVQAALVGAICGEPELLILDEPTSGLDPLVRREFLETVIGAFQESDETPRTIFVSTHLIGEFEGLVDEFTILEAGRAVLTMEADTARERYRKIRARFREPVGRIEFPGALRVRQELQEVEVVVDGEAEAVLAELQKRQPVELWQEALSLEEIFLVTVGPKER